MTRVYACSYCGIEGHQDRACHIADEGRRVADAADKLSCKLLNRLGRSAGRAARGIVAQRLRTLLERGELVLAGGAS